MQNKVEIILLSAITIFIGLAVLSGCSNDNQRMQKYDSNAQAASNTAIVVLGTKNLNFIDFNRFSNADLQIQASEPSSNTVNIQTAAKQESNQSDNNTPENNTVVSADPSKQEYPKAKLSELFKITTSKRTSQQADRQVTQAKVNHEQTKHRVLKANRILTYGYANSIYMLEPGTYYISYAYSDENNSERHLQLPGLTADNKVTYGAFTVKAGEVLYLGDIAIDWLTRDPAHMVKVEGDLQLVKQELIEADQAELAAKLTRAAFVAPGSKIEG